jgi:plasmid stabilization system protein ParE
MADKKYKLAISSAVYDDLNSHFYFLARVSESAAKRLKDALLRYIRSLAEMPDRNPLYERSWLTPWKYRYKLSAQRYRIVFEIAGDTVRVNGIQDCRQDESGGMIDE